MKNNFIIYGAYGYTGKLITELAVSKGYKPLLAGRSEEPLKALAEETGLSYQVADTKNLHKLDLKDKTVLLNCAGPFSETAEETINFCIQNGIHYTDITGEIEVFEMAKTYAEAAKEKGVMIMPGTGFDVVPSDCLAKYLSEQLPDATHLELALSGGGGVSHGTQLTVIQGLGKDGAIRKDNKIIPVPHAYEVKTFDFDKPDRTAVTFPWGDISTAHFSTGIPNIKVFMATSPKTLKWMKRYSWFKPLLKYDFVLNFLSKRVKKGGPSQEVRDQSIGYFVGTVNNASGKTVSARLQTINGYSLTAESALLIVEKILVDNFKSGFQTPASAYGADLVLEIRGSRRSDV